MCRIARIFALLVTALVLPQTVQSLQQSCLYGTRSHPTRCDLYFRCVPLPSQTNVWITTQCPQGLVYRESLGLCSVPDRNWKCEISPVITPNRSKENFYDTEDPLRRLPNPNTAGPVSFNPTTPRSAAPQHQETQLRRSSASVEKIASIGNRSDEQPQVNHNVTVRKDNTRKSTGQTKQASKTNNHGSRVNSSSNKTKGSTNVAGVEPGSFPLPADGKILPEHLAHILNQQKRLNKIAADQKRHNDPTGGAGDYFPFKDTVVFSQNPFPTNGPTAAGTELHLAIETPHSGAVKEPYVPEDIVKSILQISQQMAVNQKSASVEVTAAPKPVMRPSAEDETITKQSHIFNAGPIGVIFTSHHNLAQSMVSTNFHEPSSASEPTHYDGIPTDAIEPHINRLETSKINQTIILVPLSSSGSLHGSHTASVAPSSIKIMPYIMPQQTPTFGGMSMAYSRPMQSSYILNDTTDRYNSVFERIDNPGTSFAYEKSGVDRHANDELEPHGIPNNDAFVHLGMPGVANEANAEFNQKLLTLGNAIAKRNQYKDSILSLLDPQPDEVKISLVQCRPGIREPNKSDCFKYYVCTQQNGALHSFTCPSYTAFNKEARLCDIASYQSCREKLFPRPIAPHPLAVSYSPSSKEKLNHLHNDLLTAQAFYDLVNQAAVKQSGLNQYNISSNDAELSMLPVPIKLADSEPTQRPVKIRRKSSSGKKKNRRSTTSPTTPRTTTTTPRTTTTTPATTTTSSITTTSIMLSSVTKRRKIGGRVPHCRVEGRMPHPVDRQHYFLCTYRKSSKKFVKMKMTCPAGRVYCPSTQLCGTLAKCSARRCSIEGD